MSGIDEQALREALADLPAGQSDAPADRLVTVRRRHVRRRRLRSLAVATALGAVAGTVTAVLVANVGGGAARLQPAESPSPTASPVATSSPSAEPTPTRSWPAGFTPLDAPTHPQRVLVGPVSLPVPHGWQVSDGTGAAPQFDHACIEPPSHRPGVLGCAGLDVTYAWPVGGVLPGDTGQSFAAQPRWWPGPEQAPCPDGSTEGKGSGPLTQDPSVTRDVRAIGDRQADYYQWSVRCPDGFHFTPRAWYLPVSQVLVADRIGYDDLDPIVRDATFPPGTWKVGSLLGATATDAGVTVQFDEVRWLTGQAAIDYNEARGGHGLPANDYEIEDPDFPATVPLRLSDKVQVVSIFELAGTAPFEQVEVPVQRLVDFFAPPGRQQLTVHLHLDAAGEVDRVVEQYHP